MYFDSGKHVLPADADKLLEQVAAYAKSGANTKIGLSGYHDTSGDPKANAELAKNRARATREMLVKAGVPEDRMIRLSQFQWLLVRLTTSKRVAWMFILRSNYCGR